MTIHTTDSLFNTHYDLAVIGAGPAGYICAIKASQLGLKTTCIEARSTLGGTCLNVGCIPSKALLHNSHLYHHLKTSGSSIGISASKLTLDLNAMMSAKQSIVDSNCKGIDYLFKKNNISHIKGYAEFNTKGQLQVSTSSSSSSIKKKSTTKIINAKSIVIATGSKPIELKSICKFDHNFINDSTDALSFNHVPKTLAIIGGGVIGVEMACIWQSLGAQVHLIEAASSLVSSMDPLLTKSITRSLTKLKVKVHTNSALQSVKIKNKTTSSIELEIKKTTPSKNLTPAKKLLTDKVLVCVGRAPNIQSLNLDNASIKYNCSSQIIVDDNFQTSKKNIYAIGDVIAGPMLAHRAEQDASELAQYLAGKTSKCQKNYHLVPNVVYTQPELASIGYTSSELDQLKKPYKKGVFYLKANARSKVMGDDSGLVVVYSDKNSDQVLGVHVCAPYASEIIGQACTAMNFCASSEDIYSICHAHPTISEALKEAALETNSLAAHG